MQRLHQVPLTERRSVLEGSVALVRPGGFVGAVTSSTREYRCHGSAVSTSAGSQSLATIWLVPACPGPCLKSALSLLSASAHSNTTDLFQSVGCEEIHIEEVPLEWCVEDWEALSRTPVFIEGALWPDIDLEIGSRALIEGVRAAYAGLGIDSMRRPHLHCVARRPT